MSPQFKFFRIGITGDQAGEDELIAFLRSVRVLPARPELVHERAKFLWERLQPRKITRGGREIRG